jgi:hypothetical protein
MTPPRWLDEHGKLMATRPVPSLRGADAGRSVVPSCAPAHDRLAALHEARHLAAPSQLHAQSRTAFSGLPAVKVSEGGVERVPESLVRSNAVDVACVISEIGGKYYRAMRDNKEMVRRTSGAFTTYIAVDGSGYVRVVDSGAKRAAALIPATEATFDYVEHLLVGLRTVTYFGSAR